MPYCMYLRKSRKDLEAEARGEQETLARHRQLLTEFAAKNQLEITEVYAEVVSGDSIDARPQMQRLLIDVASGMWDGVLVVEIERLARGDTIDQGRVAKIFKDSGTKIITLLKTYDPENEYDEEYFEFSLFMSRREYKTITRRIQRGREASAREGKWIASGAPYGYERCKLPGEKGYSLRIIPEEADVVRIIFQMYAAGKSMYEISAELDRRGIPPRKTVHWSRYTVRDILSNPTYIGKLRWGRRKEQKHLQDGRTVKTRTPAEDYILVPGRHEAIIDEELYDEAQKRLAHNRKAPVAPTKLQNPVAGIIVCKKCGRLMTRLAPNSHCRYATLKCPNRYCNNVAAPIDLIEKEMLKILAGFCDDDFDWGSILPPLPSAADTGALVRQQEQLSKQRDRCYEMLEQGVYTVDVFRERIGKIDADLETMQNRLSDLEAANEQLQRANEARARFVPAVHHLLEVYDGADAAAKNAMLRELIESAEYEKKERNGRGSRNNCNFSLSLRPKI